MNRVSRLSSLVVLGLIPNLAQAARPYRWISRPCKNGSERLNPEKTSAKR